MGAAVRKKVSVLEDILAEERPKLEACAAQNGVPVGDAPDVVQKAVVKGWREGDLPEARPEATRVLLALIKWESRAALTKRARSPEQLCAQADDILQYAQGSDDEIVEANRALLRRAVPLLSAAYREVVERAYYNDQSVADIAIALGTSKHDIWQRLCRARERLREIIDGLDRGDLAACAAAASLLALLAMFDSRTFPHVTDAPLERPDAWGPARPVESIAVSGPGLATRGYARRSGSGSGAGSTSKALASLGLMSAAAAFMLVGDVPLVPAALTVAGPDAALIVAEPRGAEAGGASSVSMSYPTSSTSTGPETPPRPPRKGSKDRRLLFPAMYSPLRASDKSSGRGG
jgi:DNA-directed RNA polymerase specialized sigma24 family protein